MPSTALDLLPPSAPWIMGVLNVTPDSFSDGGRYAAVDAAVVQARTMLAEGACCLDIGGEATSPGTAPLDAAEELARIEPIVARLAGEAVLSIDTYHASTAARCLELGARIVNDVSALRADPAMADVVREHAAVLVMMHAKDGPLPHASDRPRYYGDVVREIGDFLQERVDHALARGIRPERLVLDPGWGRFVSLDPAHSFELLRRFDELAERFHPIPLLVGTSRKGFLGVPMADRDPVSQLTALAAIGRGARFVRTHAPRMMCQFLDTAGKAGLTPVWPPAP
ncbi:MAG TPA: dihydropteroate synthase [Geminicoccaceae bacterium]|nr:dihydropteroate synthase [Geminicoccus sp.]HMU51067.1 dihydropteroate synthase [Geminicoccaceae bacterium]